MIVKRGFRDKLEKYLDVTNEITVDIRVKSNIICDYCCYGVDDSGIVKDDNYVVFFNQTESPNDAIVFSSGVENGTFRLDLNKIPQDIDKLCFAIFMDNGSMCDIERYDVSVLQNDEAVLGMEAVGSDFSKEKVVIAIEIYRKDVWRISCVAQGYNYNFEEFLVSLGVAVSDEEEQPSKDSLNMPKEEIEPEKDKNETIFETQTDNGSFEISSVVQKENRPSDEAIQPPKSIEIEQPEECSQASLVESTEEVLPEKTDINAIAALDEEQQTEEQKSSTRGIKRLFNMSLKQNEIPQEESVKYIEKNDSITVDVNAFNEPIVIESSWNDGKKDYSLNLVVRYCDNKVYRIGAVNTCEELCTPDRSVKYHGDAKMVRAPERITVYRNEKIESIAVCLYSSLENGRGSFADSGAAVQISCGTKHFIICARENEDKEESYTVCLGELIFMNSKNGFTVQGLELYSQPTSERQVGYLNGKVMMDVGPKAEPREDDHYEI